MMKIPSLKKLPELVYSSCASKNIDSTAVQIVAVREVLNKEVAQTADGTQLLKDHADLLRLLAGKNIFSGKAGEIYRLDTLPDFPNGLILVGLGNELTPEDRFEWLATALKKHLPASAQTVAVYARSWLRESAELPRLVSVILESFISVVSFKTEEAETSSVNRVCLLDADYSAKMKSLVMEGCAVARAAQLMRYWADLPSNVCTPAFLADQVKALAKKRNALEVEIWNRKEIEKAGMGAFLAVAQGSAAEPRLIVVRYNGAGKEDRPVALVGKGVTFDSGGISLKPGANMGDMIYDMSGAASVLATVLAADEFNLKANVFAVAACCENMPSGTATKPGDIVRSYSGKTIEIQNTDAEGRLLLCDALAWAQEQKPVPRAVIDVATLTGACVVALGDVYSGVFSRHDDLTAGLCAAGERIGDEAWPMPVHKKYLKMMRSPVADICNLATARDAGASTAASFLSFFVKEDCCWAHMDVAGTANVGGRDHASTGRPARLLTSYLFSVK